MLLFSLSKEMRQESPGVIILLGCGSVLKAPPEKERCKVLSRAGGVLASGLCRNAPAGRGRWGCADFPGRQLLAHLCLYICPHAIRTC